MIFERLSPNEHFESSYPHSNALLQFELKLERCKPHKAARYPTKCDVINDIKLFPTVYRRIYCHNFSTLSNQTSRYKLMRPGRVAQSVTCLATDACLTADPGVASSIPVRSHTFVEIDHEMISTVILPLPLIHS